MTGSTAVATGLFELSDTPRLLGSRCAGCGTHYFPRTCRCRNPACSRPELSDAPLSRRGHLYSFTIQRYRPPPLFAMNPWEPYALGMVELPEGLRIMGMLAGVPFEQIKIGMPLELVTGKLGEDEQGRRVMTYKFGPSAPEARA